MFDLHDLSDPVYSMAAPKTSQTGPNPATQAQMPMSQSPSSFADVLRQVNDIHPLAGGMDEFWKMVTSPDQMAGPGGHQFTRGSAGGGEDPASSDYYNDAISNDQWGRIQQVLGTPMYAGVNSATGPMSQQGGVGNAL